MMPEAVHDGNGNGTRKKQQQGFPRHQWTSPAPSSACSSATQAQGLPNSGAVGPAAADPFKAQNVTK